MQAHADAICGKDVDARIARFVQSIQAHASKTSPGGQFEVALNPGGSGTTRYDVRYKVQNVERFRLLTGSSAQTTEESELKSLRNRFGGALFIHFLSGGSAGLGCGYAIYPIAGQFRASKIEGVFAVQDVNGDGLDELVVYREQDWAGACGMRVSWQQIAQIDPAQSRLVDVSATYREYYAGLQKKYADDKRMYEQSAAPVDPACSAHFDELIAHAGGLAGTPVKPAASAGAAAGAAPAPVAATGPAGKQWRRLKIGEAAGEVAFRNTGTEAVVYFAGRPVMKCVSARDAGDAQTFRALVERSSAALSPTSPQGDVVAVYCVDEDWGLRNMHLLNLRSHSVQVPKPFELVALVSEWISFSPDGRYALLNQSGDEGNYTSLLLDLRAGVASVLGVPLFSDPLTWLTPRTVKYRASDVCDEPEKCETRSSFEYEVDIMTKSVKSTKLGTSSAQPPQSR